MKRITCFTSNLTGGGAENQLTILSNLLAEKGYDVTIVTYNNIPDHYVLDKRIKRILLNVDGKNNIIKQLIISKFFFTHKTDCIISYRSVPNFILLLPLFITRKPKIIVSERNTTIVPSFREIINYNILYNRADHVVPNSHTQAKYLKGLNKKWKDRITTITNYTDVEEYSVKPVPKSTEVIKIGVFARLFPQKNYERFCFMLSKLKTFSDRQFCVYWYGDKKEGEFIKGSIHIHQLIEEYHIADVFKVKEAVSNVADYMNQFHAMCLPSLYEGFSNSISEYICCGKAVLCSDVSDNHIMVHDGVNGFLFAPTDVNSMCDAFCKFFQLTQNQIIEMGVNSRQIAETLFDKDNFINSYVRLIED